MTGKITIETSAYPGKGEVLVYVATDKDLKKSECFQRLDTKTGKKLFSKLKLHDFKGNEEQIVVLELNDFYKFIIVIGAGSQKEFTLIKWRNALARVFKTVQSIKCSQATIDYYDELGTNFFEIGKQLSISFNLSNYFFDIFKSEEEQKKIKRLDQVILHLRPGAKIDKNALDKGIKYGELLSQGVYLTRDLVNQPASHTHPETLVEEAFKIEKESKGRVKVEVLDEDECRRLGMGAFLGVGQGSEKKPKFIILKYSDSAAKILSRVNSSSSEDSSSNIHSRKILSASSLKNKCVCLIGKSITFDSGGLSLKPSESMETMKMDMAGGATVLGVFKILANMNDVGTIHELFLPEIYGILPACENMPSGKALKPGDIVTALNKKTVEVLNTDAEGRLTLADGLSYAEKYLKPDVIVDLATLTGACMVALGREITGMFGNDDSVLAAFEKIAKDEGEQLWRMPLYKPYAKKMKSDIADLKNIGGGRYGGAITAALFLAEFVNKSKWVHFDIAGPAYNDEGSINITPKGGTGWGVITLMEFLKEL